ncbi:MAG: ABC transporter permease [Deltaproteobacteria bacterium]|nr:ABC transporter permease [Deltaproteobacteria bacterium]
MNTELIVPLLAAAIQSGTPILYATLGEILTEKSGVLNLGVEGMMITGALAAFVTAQATGNPGQAFLVAGLIGAAIGAIHAIVCLWFLGNQVVSGLALTIFGMGLADYLGTPLIGQTAPGFNKLAVPLLHSIPGLGPILFQQDILVYGAILMVPLLWFFLEKCRWGLNLRAVGEHPEAAAAAGISVLRYRWIGILGGGCLAGFGGAYLSLAYTHLWTNGLSAGRGWIAVALVIFAFWRPGRALLGAYLFGGVMAFQLRLQAVGTHLPSSLLLMLPYLLTVAVLVFSSWKSKQADAPAALGVNMEPND